MEYNFSPYEIAKMAMSIEEEGARFYTALSNAASSDAVRDIFAALSREEIEHRDKFSEIAEAHHKEDKAEYTIDISTLMEKHIEEIKDLSFKVKSSAATVEDALNMAIDVEKTAINIFSKMYESFIDRFHEVLSALINEEKKHLEVLTDMKNELMSQQ